MTAVTFDTLKYANTLEAAGIGRAQAHAQAQALAQVFEVNLKDLATKGDLSAEIRELKTELKADMRELELRMTIKLGGMMVVAVGAVAALVKLL